MTMIAALELHDLIAPRVAARQPDSAHRRLSARIDQAHPLDGRERGMDFLRQLYLHLGWSAIAGSAFGCLDNGLDDSGMSMSQDHGTPRAAIIRIGVAVHIGDVRPCRLADEQGGAADGSESPHRTVDPARNQALGALE